MLFSLAQMAQISTLYNEYHRHYHNLSHIHHCLAELDAYCNYTGIDRSTMGSVELAIWFHDIVYNPRAKAGQNEKDSAALFLSEFASLSRHSIYATDIIGMFRHVEQMILATIDHKVVAEPNTREYKNTQAFLDIDLAILGQDRDTYNKYAADIRQEYSFVPAEAFATGRIAVLETLLARPSIYLTSYFHGKYESKAKENMKTEIANLKMRFLKK